MNGENVCPAAAVPTANPGSAVIPKFTGAPVRLIEQRIAVRRRGYRVGAVAPAASTAGAPLRR